jgi:hypothetical protein
MGCFLLLAFFCSNTAPIANPDASTSSSKGLSSSGCASMLRADYEESKYHMSWNYHVSMTSLVPDYSTTFHMTSHSDSYYYRD